MTGNEYQQAAMRTCNMLGEEAPVKRALHSMMPWMTEAEIDIIVCDNRHFLELWNGVLGLNGEAGECIDIFKKHVFQGHELDKKHMAEELGDVAWYLATAAHAIGYSLDEIFSMNVQKLMRRYPEGFSAERSVHRDEN